MVLAVGMHACDLRTIPDPESPEDKLFFVFVEINIDDIRELKRITKLELSGGVDAETLSAFTKVWLLKKTYFR